VAELATEAIWQKRHGNRNLWLTIMPKVVLITIMKTANVADLRNNFRLIASWISDGESVEIKKRGHPFATLIPSARAAARPMPKIDFAGRLKKIWGDRVFSDQEVAEMRMAELEGEEG
jgi:antitoxin (DNA-binding transcriptional repressor) of toxin-antitoxin stability system